MNEVIGELPTLLVVYIPPFIRVASAVVFLPGLGEASIPTMLRVGIALVMSLVLVPTMQMALPHQGGAYTISLSVVISEMLIGLWFGWLARLVATTLSVAGQYIGYLIGLSNILQTDVDPAIQSGALGVLFGMAAPAIFLASGLYRVELRSLANLFDIIPVGHMLPPGDGAIESISAVVAMFRLAVQFASPFILLSILWNILIGQMARVGGRMQIYFVSFPGQILVGIGLLLICFEPILVAWRQFSEWYLANPPGGH